MDSPGLSHTDLRALTYAEIQKSDYDGRYWIITCRNKSEVSSYKPLLDIPLQLIEKYRGLAKGNKVFPVPSDISCNNQLSKIAIQCGIHKDFTFHSSRHTFATLTLQACKDIKMVSQLLGHSSVEVTQVYAEVQMANKVDAVNYLNGKFDK